MNNFEMMRKRLEFHGGIHQEDRMIKDKFRTFQRALLYSYQAATVSLVQKHDSPIILTPGDIGSAPRALINPDKVKQDYDDKILSIAYEHGFEPGDVFEWMGTDSYWLIYLEEMTEDAYFRGEIRRCRYKLNFKDMNGIVRSTWAAIRGPVETQIESIQKNQKRIDTPNLSLNILMPRNEYTLQAFDRYKEFLFAGRCWRVEAPDDISMKNIIEVNAEENYINTDTDDRINELKDGLVFEPIVEPPTEIEGPTWIECARFADGPYEYSIDRADGKWKIEGPRPAKIIWCEGNHCKVVWDANVSGQFTLQWIIDGEEPIEKVIAVQSVF